MIRKHRFSMNIIRNISAVLIVGFCFIHIVGSTGCANMIPPTGGPRDSLPPRLISVTPRDSATGFSGKTIVFNFDEYVDLDNPIQNTIVTPTPKINPLIDRKLRTVTVKLKDTLQPNTTYIIDFGNTIKDVNEGNVLKHFSYVFSTGTYLDSLTLSGNVLLAETGKADSTLIVILHKNLQDSAVINDRPRYVTRVDTAGRFSFHYLAPGTYNLFALKDEGGSRRYLSKSTLFAFNDSPLVIGQNNPSLTLYAYAEKEVPKKTAAKAGAGAPAKGEKAQRLVVETNLANNQLELLGNMELHFQYRLTDYDSAKVHLKDGFLNDIKTFQVLKDTGDKQLTIVTKWQPDSPYNLILEKDFASDSMGRKLLKADTISFRTKKESDYGELRLRFRNLDISKNPVLEFVQNNAVKYAYPLTSTELRLKLFPPGDYDLRILYDDNKNGVWDPGEFFGKHRQPEIVVPVPIPVKNKKRVFTVKPSWETDYDFTL